MAQSPEENAANSEIIRYDLGWKAINSLLRTGRSLSGHERNCCFLNSRGRRFADVSAVTGLDFDDDGRVLALSDWDYDGDVDFWVANRSGPQLRYLQNRLSKDLHFVAIRLQGVNCNRDALGARVKVVAVIDGKRVEQSQSLKAGEGYLAQNSKWLHFGLGDATEIEQAQVVWPNGETQTLPQLDIDRWYRIREGEEPVRWSPPRPVELPSSEFAADEVSDRARILLLQPLPLPAIRYTDASGVERTIGDQNKPTVVNLWATWCQSCLRELGEWSKQEDAISRAGLRVLAINVDEESAQRAEAVARVETALGLPFESGMGARKLTEQFDVLQRSLLSRQRPLPLPASFLIDGAGRLRAIYKGPVAMETLLRDVELIGAERSATLAAATPFKGEWLQPPGGSTPMHLAVKYIEGGLIEEATSYVDTLMQQREAHPEYVTAGLMNLYGAALLEQRDFEGARAAFAEAVNLDPANRQARIELGTILMRSGRGAAAVEHFESVLHVTPEDPELLYKLGMAFQSSGEPAKSRAALLKSVQIRPNAGAWWQLGNVSVGLRRTAEAVYAYEQAISLNDELALKANNLAWLLATSDKAEIRNADRALELAGRIHDAAATPNASTKDTLAAAYAAAENFPAAIKTATEAVELANSSGNVALATRIAKRLRLYRERKPFRESL